MALRLRADGLPSEADPTLLDPGTDSLTLRHWLAYKEGEREEGRFAAALDYDEWRERQLAKLQARQLAPRDIPSKLRLRNAQSRISNTPATRQPIPGNEVDMPTHYAGTVSRDGYSQDATNPTLKRNPLESAIPLSDVAVEHDGLTHVERTRSPLVIRSTLDETVHESATLRYAHNRQPKKGG